MPASARTTENWSEFTREVLARKLSNDGRLVPAATPIPQDVTDSSRSRIDELVSLQPPPRWPVIGGTGPSFSVERFADELRSRLDGKAKGWSFAITADRTLAAEDAGGDARTPNDGELEMTPTRRVNIASVSKTITAVAVLKLLDDAGLDTNDRIWPFLPEDWILGPGVTELRFRDLLGHRSGLTSTNSDFNTTLTDDGLAQAIATGGAANSAYQYLNANFALFRVIIPELWRAAGNPASNNNTGPEVSAVLYESYIVLEVFRKMAGVFSSDPSTLDVGANPPLYYETEDSASGLSLGDWRLIAGGGGWHLSARELAAFMTYMTYDDEMLSPAARLRMDSLRLGWSVSGTGPFGRYYGHDGAIGAQEAVGVAIWKKGAVRAGVVKFPIQCEAALVANSKIEGYASASGLLNDAFSASWR